MIFALLVAFVDAKAQSFVGFLTENYSGVNSVIANPAYIVDSRFNTDINIFGFSVFGGNDYYNLNIIKAFKDDNYDFDANARLSPKVNNNGEANIDFFGPSFMFNINKNNSIALFTRARSFININGINGRGLYDIDKNISEDFLVTDDEFNAFGQAWAEIGLSFASVLYNDMDDFIKGGISLKYLRGGGSAYVAASNLSVYYDEGGTALPGGGTTGSVSSTGDVIYGRFDDFEAYNYDYKFPINARGLGIDIGFVYEWRPRYGKYKPTKVWPERFDFKDYNKYKLRLGFSVTDIGYINYANGIEDVFDVTNNNVSEAAIYSQYDLYSFLSNLYSLTSTSVGYRAKLPTALHLNADWSFTNRFYLNVNMDLSVWSKINWRANKITNMVSVTPRYESSWLSFYTPISLVQYSGLQVGTGLRLGPLYIGSSSLFTNLLSNKSKGSNFYVGFKIPILQKGIDKGSNCNCY
ncbi:MAG: DUF5723 family protein [Tamlana sp.]